MSAIRFRPSAESDLEEVEEYLATNASADVAANFLDETERRLELLFTQPAMGRVWRSSHPRLSGVRIWPLAYDHLAFYLPIADPRGIEVLRILHGARDIEAILDGEP